MLQLLNTPTMRREPSRLANGPIVHATELIDRYPNLSEVELARLINLFSELSALDVALMISDKNLGPNLDRFRADHQSQLMTPFRQYAVLVAIAVSGIFLIAWSVAFVQ